MRKNNFKKPDNGNDFHSNQLKCAVTVHQYVQYIQNFYLVNVKIYYIPTTCFCSDGSKHISV